MAQAAQRPACVSTGTIWTVLGNGKQLPSKANRYKKGMHYRVTQPQGDCLYLCFIGLLQSEKAEAQKAHLKRIRRFAVVSANLFDDAVWATIVQDWKTLNVKHPGPYPVQAVQPLRRIVAAFLERHFEYYWNGGDEFDRAVPRFLEALSPMKEDFRILMRQTLNDLSAHFVTWHPEAGHPIDQDDIDAARSAYCRMIQMRYPNDEPIQQREMSAGAESPYENALNFGDQLEAHVAAQLFGVDISICVWSDTGDMQTWEDGRVQTVVLAKIQSAPIPSKGIPWCLMNKNGTHYDYFETSKVPGYTAPAGAGGGRSRRRLVSSDDDDDEEELKIALALSLEGSNKKPKVGNDDAAELSDEELERAIALSLKPPSARAESSFHEAMETEDYKQAEALALANDKMAEAAQLRDAVVQFRHEWRLRLGQAINRKEDVRVEDAAIENEMKARMDDASNGKSTAVQWAILRLLVIQSFVHRDYELPALTTAFNVFLEMRLEENGNDPHIAALAVQQHMHENNT